MADKTGGPAFPTAESDYQASDDGMSLREYFASQAPEPPKEFKENFPGFPDYPANWGHEGTMNRYRLDVQNWYAELHATWAFQYADAMLKARGES